MDTQFHPNNNMNNSNTNYNPLPGISPHQLQQNSNMPTHTPTHTLPPLQASPHTSMQPMYSNSAPQTPRSLATPNTPTSSTAMNFPQMGHQTPSRYQLMPNNNQQARGYQIVSNGNEQGYRNMTTMVPQSPNTTTSMSYPQAIAPAPQNRIPQALRPLPQGGLHLQGAMQSPYGQNNMLSQMSDIEPPTHVVGSQGRRGILPSAPGRPPVNSNTGKNAMIPTKDADGKFPCPHCTKTYLHAKHLKRHLLRHTGDRPYMCILCRDTFSRSDILKRHFQKCSIRRGNPTGASHLAHSQAHLKKPHPSPLNKSVNENSMMEINGMPTSNGGMQIFGVVPDPAVTDPGSNLLEQQVDQLQSNNIKRISSGGGGNSGGGNSGTGGPNNGNENDGRHIAGMGPEVTSRTGLNSPYAAGATSSSMPPGMNPSVAFNMNPSQNGHSYNQGYDYSNGNNANAPANNGMEKYCMPTVETHVTFENPPIKYEDTKSSSTVHDQRVNSVNPGNGAPRHR